MYFVGVVIGSTIIPRLSDIYGRKPFVVACTILHLVSGALLLLTSSLKFGFFLMFCIGVAMSGRATVGYVWLTESLRIQDTTKNTAGMFFVDSLAIFFASLYFKYISKDWVYLYTLPLIVLTINVIVLCFQEEAPKFLHGIQNYEKTRKVLTVIGRQNGVLTDDQEFTGIFSEEKRLNKHASQNASTKSHGVKDFAKNRRHVINALVFIMLSTTCNFCYYLINFFIKYIPGDIYVNQLVNSLSEAFANGPLMLVVASLFTTKNGYFL